MPRVLPIAALLALAVALGAPAAGLASTPSANPPGAVQLSDEQLTTRWANTADVQPVFSRPSEQAHRVARLRLLTEDKFPQPYVVLADWSDPKGTRWFKLRLPGRPNGRTGWVTELSLGDLSSVNTSLVVNRRTLRVTLYKAGKQIFQAPIGVGKSSTRTPAGHFWVTEKFHVRGAPVYGTRAIGTSAYAPGLTDWPGGGVVGMHGTNEPGLIPGRPSHGCIRLRNAAITRLYRLVPKGTPIEII